jgi:hypothetical protein
VARRRSSHHEPSELSIIVQPPTVGTIWWLDQF